MEVNETPHVSLRFPVSEPSQVGVARRYAAALADKLGFTETQQGRVGVVVTEAGTNLYKHGGGGELIIRTLPPENGIEILAVDKGRGMQDIEYCMQDGHSTAGSPGTGLGAIARMAGEFNIFSQPQKGTVLVARLYAKEIRRGPAKPRTAAGAVCIPYPGETACGDAWVVRRAPGRIRAMVVDGLGHGPAAAEASRAALEVFDNYPDATPLQLVERAHAALASTRGAALAVVSIETGKSLLHFAGVGNIAATVLSGTTSRGLASYNGTVGHQIYKLQEMSYPWPENALLIMHSDGISNRWKPEDYPGMANRDPSIVAALLYRDFQRRDDITALAVTDER